MKLDTMTVTSLDLDLDVESATHLACYKSDAPAGWLAISPCGCDTPICDAHKRSRERAHAHATLDGRLMRCVFCGTRDLNPMAVRWVPIS
jgi:hypothetical protein